MKQIKPLLITVALALAAVAIAVRVPQLKKLVFGATA
jgi:hypothetical protein